MNLTPQFSGSIFGGTLLQAGSLSCARINERAFRIDDGHQVYGGGVEDKTRRERAAKIRAIKISTCLFIVAPEPLRMLLRMMFISVCVCAPK